MAKKTPQKLIESYCSTQPLPFRNVKSQRIVVKIVDDRGIEGLKVVILILRGEVAFNHRKHKYGY